MAADRLWCRVTLVGPGGSASASWRFDGAGAPDLETVDALARLRLTAGRVGWTLVVTDACAELSALVDLAGLQAVLSAERARGVRRRPR